VAHHTTSVFRFSSFIPRANGLIISSAPEVIMHCPYSTSPDYWTLGIIIHEMVTGDAPYDRTHRMHTDTDEMISSEAFSDYQSISTIESETSAMIRPSSRHYHM
jgi:serine/threonine protein kinase